MTFIKHTLVLSGVLIGLGASTSFAQENTISPAQTVSPAGQSAAPADGTMSPGSGSMSGTGLMRGEGSPYQLRASDLLGMDVINSSGEDIGEIDDLTVGEDGSIEAVLALGGVLGMGEKMVTISYDNMQFDEEREHLIVNITEEELENMDEFQYMEGEQRGREITPGMY